MTTPQSFECELAGRKLVIETGKLAGQATSAVTVRYGDTLVLVTLCVAEKPREGVDFLPLTVDYEERLYAVGKIPGGFIRREGRPSQEARDAIALIDHVQHRNACHRAEVMGLTAGSRIERGPVEVQPAVGAAPDHPRLEGAKVGVRVVQTLGQDASSGAAPDRQRTQTYGAPSAIATRRTMEPCRCVVQRMRRQRSQTPPVFTAKASPHSSHSVLKIDFRNTCI